MQINTQKLTRAFALVLTSLLLITACDNNNNNGQPVVETPEPTPEPPVTQEFELVVINATAAQPLSPIAVIAHNSDFSVFTIGSPATPGLELLAEGGDNADLIAEAEADAGVTLTSAADGPTPPGGSTTLNLVIEEDQLPGMLLSAVTMLVNSNDAITAARNLSLEGMEPGDERTVVTISYDSGTEANSESAGTIPGPADGGEGFNADRDDIVDEVRGHPGVLSADNGLPDSILSEVHRWDHPVAYMTVRRVQ